MHLRLTEVGDVLARGEARVRPCVAEDAQPCETSGAGLLRRVFDVVHADASGVGREESITCASVVVLPAPLIGTEQRPVMQPLSRAQFTPAACTSWRTLARRFEGAGAGHSDRSACGGRRCGSWCVGSRGSSGRGVRVAQAASCGRASGSCLASMKPEHDVPHARQGRHAIASLRHDDAMLHAAFSCAAARRARASRSPWRGGVTGSSATAEHEAQRLGAGGAFT